ncbi:NAD(P)-dependent alcohol dehydrogenase [Serratia sp. CY54717]|uniref:NAD(P)-dependent alcohol dehydrogenase n=1 Tax=Serratia sp. CY54717 TaxID=3383637 RepID=UPI003FA0F200
MKAALLNKKRDLVVTNLPNLPAPAVGEVQIAIRSVGICGSDIHYFVHGRIGAAVVDKPMVIGHEASGVVTAVGENVTHLKPGDRVCMEPGIPDFHSKETLRGIYNLDPAVKFWATPPVHGCLAEKVNHPASLTFKLPESVSFNEGAFVEPLSIGLHAAIQADIKAGDTALVLGCGTIGIVTAISALMAGCSKVIISDVQQSKLDIAAEFTGMVTVNTRNESVTERVKQETQDNGVNIVFDCCGIQSAVDEALSLAAPQATIMLIACPTQKLAIDVLQSQTKELSFKTIYRYRNIYPRAINLLASKKFDLTHLIGRIFSLENAPEAFEYAARGGEGEVKVMFNLNF